MLYQQLYNNLGYEFHNINLISRALRHRSTGNQSNERLEFLGDAILNFIIASALYSRYPLLNEGELSRMRSNLVNSDILAELAAEFKICDFIQVGSNENKNGISKKKSILADTMEAIIGAMYLDSNLNEVHTHILKWFENRLDKTSGIIKKDPKSELQELIQMNKLPLPLYEVINISGADHERTFTISCKIFGINDATIGSGQSKRLAERKAAKMMLKLFKENLTGKI